MPDNKKYYWLKLKEDFFEEKQVKYLRGLPDGEKLVIAYLKMQLKSLRTEGFIKYDQILPSSEEELAMALDEDVNIIKLLVAALLQVKAIEKLDDGSFYMIAMQELIGKEGQSAERVRNFRERQKQKKLLCNSNVTDCNTEIEKREKRKEIKEQEVDKCPPNIDIELEINNNSSSEEEQEKIFLDDFEKLWNIYPNKKGKNKAYTHYKQWIKGKKYLGTTKKLSNKEMWYAIKIYKKEIKEEQKENFTKNGSTFFNEAIYEYSEKYNDNQEYWEKELVKGENND